MYPNHSRKKSVRCAALAAVLLPALLPGAASAAQLPQLEDELIPLARPMPFMEPFFESGDFDDRDVLMSLDGYDSFGSSSTVETLEAEAKRIDELIKEAKESLDKARKGDDKARQRASEDRIESLEKARVGIRKAAERAARLAPLQKKVDVKFENATVAQAAEALSRAAGIQIKVDDSIPDTTRLTVEARKVRLATVLESVARQAGLTIEPVNLEKGDVGVELTAPPMLRVNDTVQRFPVSASPWSAKWGSPPTHRFIYSSTLPSLWRYSDGNGKTITRAYANGISSEILGNVAALSRTYGNLATVAGGGHALISVEKGTTIEVAKPGTITITEAGKNDKNEDGFWTTVYTLKDGELVKQGRTWSKTKRAATPIAPPAPAAPSAPAIAIPDSSGIGYAVIVGAQA